MYNNSNTSNSDMTIVERYVLIQSSTVEQSYFFILLDDMYLQSVNLPEFDVQSSSSSNSGQYELSVNAPF